MTHSTRSQFVISRRESIVATNHRIHGRRWPVGSVINVNARRPVNPGILVVPDKMEDCYLRPLLLILVLIGLGTSANAQAPGPQNSRTLLQFLKPGDLVGVQSVDETISVAISIYSKEQFELATVILSRGRSTMNAKQFATENQTARRALDQYVSQQGDPSLAVDQLSVMPLIRTSLGKITEVGADYVLIELDGSQRRRCVIAKSAIGKIYLDATPIRFFGPRRVANVKNG